MMLLIKKQYEERYEILSDLSQRLELLLTENITCPRIDDIACRAKSVQSFVTKAFSKRKDGSVKYTKPLQEIQDQIGARIVTFYKSDVEVLKAEVYELFRGIEQEHHIPKREDQFGYEGLHFILHFPHELVPKEYKEYAPQFFELQIKTLFQHAWSEAEHDLGYKGRGLNSDAKRKLAFTAAQAWGADEIFNELFLASKEKEDSAIKTG